jgi:hypothetical protein
MSSLQIALTRKKPLRVYRKKTFWADTRFQRTNFSGALPKPTAKKK